MLIEVTDAGLYCAAGDFHIDPWAPVATAVLTHAHADHARPGSAAYLAATPGLPVLAHRLPEAPVEGLAYGEVRQLGRAAVSLHPAGHVRGSAQVRVELDGRVAVVTGDFKRAADPTCAPFEPLTCHELVCEATFGLPLFHWRPVSEVRDEMRAWWTACADAGKSAVLGTYSLGKAQRVLALLGADAPDFERPGEIRVHGAIAAMNDAYRASGCALPEAARVADAPEGHDWAGALILATPAAIGSRWMRRFRHAEVALASGWMRVRGNRRWRGVDRGFALSDHADWPALLATIDASGAEVVHATHGSAEPLARFLAETRGLRTGVLPSRFEGEPS